MRDMFARFDAVAALVTVMDSRGRIVSFNRACELLTGFNSEELVGRYLWEVLIAPEQVDEVRSVFDSLAAGRFPNKHENYWLTKSGDRRWIAWSNTTQLDASGDVQFVIGTGVDISETKQIHDELRRSEERFRILVESVPDYAIFMLDPQGRVVSWNMGAQSITGYRHEDIIGKDFSAYYTQEDIDAGKPREQLELAAKQGHVTVEGWRVRKDGTRFYASVSITSLRDPDGALRGFAKVTRDRTALWKEEERQRFFDKISDVLAHALPDFDETLHAVARLTVETFADLCSISRVDDEGRAVQRVAITCADAAVASTAERLRSIPVDRMHEVIVGRVLKTRKAELHDLASYLREAASLDPRYVDVVRELGANSFIITPLVSRGRALGIIALSRTRSAPFNEDDLRLAQELGERAGLHVDNARLYRHSAQALQARDAIMSIVAHDLRNPLNSINLHAQVLLRGLRKPDVTEDTLAERGASLETIKDEVTRMNRLITDLFDAARTESGQLVQGIKLCDPERLVREGVESARALASAKQLSLRSNVEPNLPTVGADSERVHQVFSNLLGNAIKFTPTGGTITVSAALGDGCVVFAVQDTGPGIAPEDIPRVFDRFWQGKRADRRGVGLGLWICNGIIESHHGVLTVESTLGEGSKFKFTLPISSQ